MSSDSPHIDVICCACESSDGLWAPEPGEEEEEEEEEEEDVRGKLTRGGRNAASCSRRRARHSSL